MVINKENLSLIFMINSYVGAVRGQSDTKYGLLRAPSDGLLVFCLAVDQGTVERPNQHSI